MDVTEEGMVIEVRDEHLLNASFPMDVTEEGMVTCPLESGGNRQSALALPNLPTIARKRTRSADGLHALSKPIIRTSVVFFLSWVNVAYYRGRYSRFANVSPL